MGRDGKPSATEFIYQCDCCGQDVVRKYQTDKTVLCKFCYRKIYYLQNKPVEKMSYTCAKCGAEYNHYHTSGLCKQCYYKEKTLPTQNDNSKKRYQKLKSQGLCVACGATVSNGISYCPECIQKQHKAATKRHKKWSKEGKCTMCGREPVPGKKRCAACTISQTIHQRERRAKLPKKPKKVIQKPVRCPICNKVFIAHSAPGKYCSDECRTIGLAKKQKIRQIGDYQRRKKKYLEQGLCWRCLKPMDNTTYSVCLSCREHENQRLREYNRRRKHERSQKTGASS